VVHYGQKMNFRKIIKNQKMLFMLNVMKLKLMFWVM